ncbi:hypothetical protein PACTADRAFT_50368 [Pachysolen tannophilus NRRL Y-2460]|uniref:Chromosome transmission fidelity protein 8 n=1 Tax=Pachysolen tannophilus NRRL Y-2460 TaxID=669874 RepID=A0A1E4TVA1_PACTA|nr:hypothetical protein PACTADRAFT_50368 [Pachysolen tannophilus NRRL Y-2460]
MPSAEVDYSKAHDRLESKEGIQNNSSLIDTPGGLAILEIQGVLNLPTKLNSTHQLLDDTAIDSDLVRQAIKFGDLQLEDNNKATLYIGKSQRLVGTVESIDPPLGVLKFSNHVENDENKNSSSKIEMIEIVDKKIVFRTRPLPIM